MIVALIGPTAAGKTDVSIELARRLNAEIVGCDSMQVYHRMAALTLQPSMEQQRQVRHHLVDCVEPTEVFNVGHYRRLALEAIRDIEGRGKTALLVGGTGMYLKALTRGLCDAPPADPQVRRELSEVAAHQGPPVLHERLKTVDPEAAAKIHPNDAQRLVRALEVFTLTGRPLSGWWSQSGEAMRIRTIVLTRDRAELHARINARVERMLADEAVLQEARALRDVPLSVTARQVHGLRFVQEYLDRRRNPADTIMVWQAQVRQYARRQLIWFRAVPDVEWITLTEGDTLEALWKKLS